MNSDFYDDLELNFEKAFDMYAKNFRHEDLVAMLKSGNIQEKQFAALNIESLNNSNEFEIFIKNLTGCDGKIREAIAFKMLVFLQEDEKYYTSLLCDNLFDVAKIFADATIDINANICRSVIDCVKFIKSNEDFRKKYTKYILKHFQDAFDSLDKIIYRDKKYTINKQLFKLYWCLEALKHITEYLEKEELYKILQRASKEQEYTIREKIAQILVGINDKSFDSLRQELSNDSNYYVQKILSEK